jgi:hypothetical protein
MPFTQEQFFALFERYNRAIPLVIGLTWVATAVLTVRVFRGRHSAGPLLTLMIFQWAWVGVAFHFVFFTKINPAAWIFGALFVGHAILLSRYTLRDARMALDSSGTIRHALGLCLMIYGLIYPALSVLAADRNLALPLFLVPCPLVIIQTGVLLMMRKPVPRALFVVPAVWSVIGASAAVLFDVLPDFALFLCAVLLVVGFYRQRTVTPRLRLAA